MANKISLILATLGLVVSCSAHCAQHKGNNNHCPSALMVEQHDSILDEFNTDTGMHGLWDFQSFKQICSNPEWESNFVESGSIRKLIKRGAFVPIYVFSDGSPVIELRIGAQQKHAKLSSTEQGLVAHQSEPYLFISNGSVSVSGIEFIRGNVTEDVKSAYLKTGRWTVIVYLMHHEHSPQTNTGVSSKHFIVTINPETKKLPYRETEATFSDLW